MKIIYFDNFDDSNQIFVPNIQSNSIIYNFVWNIYFD